MRQARVDRYSNSRVTSRSRGAWTEPLIGGLLLRLAPTLLRESRCREPAVIA
jgi:hypothetical protein